MFERNGGPWEQQAKLMAPDGVPNDQFGKSVAVAKDTVVVGAHFHDDSPLDRASGAVYVVDRMADGWNEPTRLTDGADRRPRPARILPETP